MLDITIDFKAEPIIDMLRHLEFEERDIEHVLKEVVKLYRTKLQPEIFSAHEKGNTGGSGHKNWKPLSQKYLESKLKRTSPHPSDILQLTGAFKDDLTRGTSFTIEEYNTFGSEGQAVFGTTREYPVWAGAGNGGTRQADVRHTRGCCAA